MKCTLFGEYVDKVISFMDKPENEPDILVAQLFKPHFYLNEVSVQNSLYASQIFFNPDIADVSFKNRKYCVGLLEQLSPLRYQLNVVITDGTGCVNLIIWNQEANRLWKSLQAISGQTDNDSDEIGVAVVSLSKDSIMESNFDIGLETPAKPTSVEFVSHAAIMVGMDSPDVQDSSNKTTRLGARKRKIE
ncbi:hypothetical protein AHAS_Ahas04G0147000 [Arachis hypogaea]